MGNEQNYQSSFVDIAVTIPSGASTPTSGVATFGLTPIGIIFPAAMTGANLSFTTNNGSGTYVTVNSLTMAVTVSNLVPFGSTFAGMQLGDDWKPVSDGTEGADRALIVRCRRV